MRVTKNAARPRGGGRPLANTRAGASRLGRRTHEGQLLSRPVSPAEESAWAEEGDFGSGRVDVDRCLPYAARRRGVPRVGRPVFRAAGQGAAHEAPLAAPP